MQQVVRKNIAKKYDVVTEPVTYTLLLDMNSIMKMSLVDKRLGTNGKEYGMVFQTLIVIRNQLMKKTFNFVYAMYDGHNSGQLRYNLYKDYKSNRDKNYSDSGGTSAYYKAIDDFCKRTLAYSKGKSYGKPVEPSRETEDESFERQREILFSILDELFIRQLISDDVEGDDLIAYYVKHKKPNEKVVIVSGDRDITQLIADDVCVYIPSMKKYITPANHLSEMGYTHENVMLKKIFCGDASDAIKGIKGLGETTFFKMFPKAVTERMTVDEVIESTKRLIDERKAEKKKPLKVMENIVGRVTDGIQGERIYEINKAIIDLTEPLLTDEAVELIEGVSYAPLDPEGRDFQNVYKIVTENTMTDWVPVDKFTNFFHSFNPLMEMEKKFFNSEMKNA